MNVVPVVPGGSLRALRHHYDAAKALGIFLYCRANAHLRLEHAIAAAFAPTAASAGYYGYGYRSYGYSYKSYCYDCYRPSYGYGYRSYYGGY